MVRYGCSILTHIRDGSDCPSYACLLVYIRMQQNFAVFLFWDEKYIVERWSLLKIDCFSLSGISKNVSLYLLCGFLDFCFCLKFSFTNVSIFIHGDCKVGEYFPSKSEALIILFLSHILKHIKQETAGLFASTFLFCV